MIVNITQLLVNWSDGDQSALDRLMPLVYNELRRQARGYLRRRGNQYSLQPTAIVNEVYLRLVNQRQVNLRNRAQFFGLAAKLMRTLMVDYVRHRRAAKRGGGEYHLSLTQADRYLGPAGSPIRSEVDLIALDEALNRLAALNPQQSKVVELRFFGGLTLPEAAEALNISRATVDRHWSAARAWLYSELSR